jgi:transposase-like protein
VPRTYPPEFRRRAVELARERAKPIAVIASDLGISESCLRRWMDRADIDEGVKEGMTTVWPTCAMSDGCFRQRDMVPRPRNHR